MVNSSVIQEFADLVTRESLEVHCAGDTDTFYEALDVACDGVSSHISKVINASPEDEASEAAVNSIISFSSRVVISEMMFLRRLIKDLSLISDKKEDLEEAIIEEVEKCIEHHANLSGDMELAITDIILSNRKIKY